MERRMGSVMNYPAALLPRRASLGDRLGDVTAAGILASHRSYEGGVSLATHEHEGAYVCIVLAGGYSQTSTSRMDCGRGSFVSHPPGHVHANRFGAGSTRCLNLYFDVAWLVDPALGELLGDYRQVRLDPHDAALSRLERELAISDAGSALGVASAALDVAGRAIRAAADSAPSWLSRIREAIAGDLAQPPSLATLAAEVGVHPAHLCRSFRKATGETIGAYSRRVRLEAASAMMAGRGSIAEIASATGFYDQAHFARCFRRQFGRTPTALRTQLAS